MNAIRFSGFEVHPDARRLLAQGEPVVLGSRAFDLLLVLIELRERLVSKNELLDRVWPDVIVEENNLTVQISSLRKALGSQVITTVPGRGYRFTATLESPAGAVANDPPPPLSTPAREGSGSNGVAALPALIGREDELVTLCALTREHRVVSIVGAGGIGKTHLVRHLLQRRRPEFSDGAHFVDLSAVHSHPDSLGQIERTIASALNIQLGAAEAGRGLPDAIAAREMLLALDNAEHLVDGVAGMAELLVESAPQVHLVITTQVPLAIASERVFRLGSLTLPDGPASPADALTHSAIAFFVDRAQATDRRFALTADNVDLVVDVCRQLDGLALAIELAAARIPTLGLRGLANALEERFRLLTGGRRLAPARQQTLHAALDWSHELLSANEKTVFRRLGVFIDSFALATAQQVATDEQMDEWTVLDALTGLVDRSLVVTTEHEPPRYRLLDTPRAYARERLQSAGEAPTLARRCAHALRDRFCAADHDWWTGRLGADAFRAAAEPDLADGKAALSWAVQHDPHTAVALAPCLDWAMVNEPAIPNRRALWEATRSLINDSSMPDALRTRWWCGWQLWATMIYGEVTDEERQHALDEVRRIGDRAALFWMLKGRLSRLTLLATNDTAVEAEHQCIVEMRQLADASWPPVLRYHLMRAEFEHCRNVGDLAGALQWLRLALTLADEAGDSRARYSAMVAAMDTQLLLKHYDDAVRAGTELVEALRSTRFESTLTYARHNLVHAHVWQRDFAAARAVSRDAWPLLIRFDLVGMLAHNLALLAASEGRSTDAARLVGYADYQASLRGEEQQINELRAVREAERIAIVALGTDEVARLKAEGASLTRADVKRLALAKHPDTPTG